MKPEAQVCNVDPALILHVFPRVLKSLPQNESDGFTQDADTAWASPVRFIWQREMGQSDNCPCLALSGPIRGPVG